MNKVITIPLAGIALVAALAGCKSSPGVSASQASQRAHALSTSSQAAEAQQEGGVLAETCLPAKDLNRAYFVQLAVNLSAAKALAAKCDIPKASVEPFAKAVFSSAAKAYLSGNHFDTPAKRDGWINKDLAPILKQYQGKK